MIRMKDVFKSRPTDNTITKNVPKTKRKSKNSRKLESGTDKFSTGVDLAAKRHSTGFTENGFIHPTVSNKSSKDKRDKKAMDCASRNAINSLNSSTTTNGPGNSSSNVSNSEKSDAKLSSILPLTNGKTSCKGFVNDGQTVINANPPSYHLNLKINNPQTMIYNPSSGQFSKEYCTNKQSYHLSIDRRKPQRTICPEDHENHFRRSCICHNQNPTFSNNNYIFKTFQSRPKNSYFLPVLQYAFGQEKTNRNDFIILGLGINHYIKELFNALDFNNDGFVYFKDVEILCKILGRELKSISKSDMSLYSRCNKDGNPNHEKGCTNELCEVHLRLSRFTEIICSTFTDWDSNTSLERRKNTQLINAVVNITRRKESLDMISKQLNELENEYMEFIKTSSLRHSSNSLNTSKVCDNVEKRISQSDESKYYEENIKLKRITLLQQQELQCLREVIEDLRVSLQCSDAENLGLKVKECKMETFSLSSSSDTFSTVSQRLSSVGDRDSIDRMIEGFPSDERLDNGSMDSLLSSNSSSLNVIKDDGNNYTPNHASPNDVNHNPSPQNESDLDEPEFQKTFQKLSEMQKELEFTRDDLETSVIEIQEKSKEISHLNKNLTDTKKVLQKTIQENSNLKSKIVSMMKDKGGGQNMNFMNGKIATEVSFLKSVVSKKEAELEQVKKELNVTSNQRNMELRQLAATRNIIAKILLEIRKHENNRPNKISENSFDISAKNLKPKIQHQKDDFSHQNHIGCTVNHVTGVNYINRNNPNQDLTMRDSCKQNEDGFSDSRSFPAKNMAPKHNNNSDGFWRESFDHDSTVFNSTRCNNISTGSRTAVSSKQDFTMRDSCKQNENGFCNSTSFPARNMPPKHNNNNDGFWRESFDRDSTVFNSTRSNNITTGSRTAVFSDRNLAKSSDTNFTKSLTRNNINGSNKNEIDAPPPRLTHPNHNGRGMVENFHRDNNKGYFRSASERLEPSTRNERTATSSFHTKEKSLFPSQFSEDKPMMEVKPLTIVKESSQSNVHRSEQSMTNVSSSSVQTIAKDVPVHNALASFTSNDNQESVSTEHIGTSAGHPVSDRISVSTDHSRASVEIGSREHTSFQTALPVSDLDNISNEHTRTSVENISTINSRSDDHSQNCSTSCIPGDISSSDFVCSNALSIKEPKEPLEPKYDSSDDHLNYSTDSSTSTFMGSSTESIRELFPSEEKNSTNHEEHDPKDEKKTIPEKTSDTSTESKLTEKQPWTSTQILEGLEAEVEYLRRSLEDEQLSV